jgi:hypothetical protein
MMGFVSTGPVLGLALLMSSAAMAQTPAPAAPQPAAPTAQAAPAATPHPTLEPEAVAALERMGAYLRTLTTFGGQADVTSEEVLPSGQKIQYTGAIDLVASRPNRLRLNLDSTRKRRQYFYDGRTLTIWSPRQGYYATLDAPPTIHEMIRTFSERYDIVIPFADLFAIGQDPAILARIQSGFFVGTEAVDDQICDHYAFRQENADWQIWIREGDEPLPCRLVITSREDPALPEYESRFRWNLQPVVTAETFTFTPPEGADRIPVETVTAARAQ